ncbi:hypothetical protein H663_018780 [Limnohabitans planktonicus II-D5]|uniref:Nucleotidyl transferase domain-containing protein n=1 Tax=Limnohabitans planktonicus II-D5 TaxID=1293045 RepID=A0A2T7U8Z8_9BURK|nr:hypothetical protein H663_018780 [Limnohabitans planktonicus II-D5]
MAITRQPWWVSSLGQCKCPCSQARTRGSSASSASQKPAAPLAPLLRAAMDRGEVSGEVFLGAWTDAGTPERLAEVNAGL